MNQSYALPTTASAFARITMCLAIFFSTTLSFSSCTNKMAMFDQPTFDSAKSLTTKALDLIGLATKPFSENESVVNGFMNAYDKHLNLEKNRGENNAKTVQMWELLMNPNENLLGGFINKWKSEGSLSQIFVDNAKREIGENLKKIISLESKKKKG